MRKKGDIGVKKAAALLVIFFMMIQSGLASMAKVSPAELNHVGELIFKNETGGKRELLVHWNVGEEFPSLGLGHFIWYPENFKNGKFDESFPGLVGFYKSKGIKVPDIMGKNRYAPWKSREEFLTAKNSPQVVELIDFLDRTKDIQIEYIYERSQKALEKMMKYSKNPEHVKRQYERVAASPNGIYPLIDYVNFKGEGIKDSERYNGEGWGLLQVLETMKGNEVGQAALEEFSERSAAVLKRRVENSPPERGEKRWLQNWENRCKSYSRVK